MRQLSKSEAAKYMDCSERTLERMVKKGELNPIKSEGKVFFLKKELKELVSKVSERQDKYIPKSSPIKEPEKPVSPRTLIFEMNEKPDDLLNDIGRGEVMRVTKMLTEAGLIESTDRMLIMKYALCQQMYFKYLAASDERNDLQNVADNNQISAFFKMMESYQRQAQFYEKELGLTTAARIKMKPPEAKEPEDEMEGLLNG